jgi:hypothetical protein
MTITPEEAERLAIEAGMCYSLGERPGELAFHPWEDDDVRESLVKFARLVIEFSKDS